MDVGPDIDSVELSIRAALSGKPGISVNRAGEVLDVHESYSQGPIATVDWSCDRRSLSVGSWHGHFDSGEELTHTLLMLLGGYSKTVEEFKGQTLTVTLLMNYDREGWFINKVAYYLDPHRPELWQLADGEEWAWVFTTRKLIDASNEFRSKYPDAALDSRNLPPNTLIGERRVVRDRPKIWQDDTFFAWYERRYGPPMQGFRWTQTTSSRMIFQVPSSWSDFEVDEAGYVSGYRSPDSAMEIHVRTWTRAAEDGFAGSKPLATVAYETLQTASKSVEEGGVAWIETHWEIQFTNGEEDMLASFLIRRTEVGALEYDSLLLESTLEEALKLALFIPISNEE